MLLITLFQIWNVQKRKDRPWEELSIIPFILKTDYLHLKTGYKDESAWLWKQLKWNKFPFYGDRLDIQGINIADSVSERITSEEQSPLIRRQVVWRKYSEQMTEKQNSVKTCTKSPKMETTFIYGNRCSFDQKGKVVHIKQVWVG